MINLAEPRGAKALDHRIEATSKIARAAFKPLKKFGAPVEDLANDAPARRFARRAGASAGSARVGLLDSLRACFQLFRLGDSIGGTIQFGQVVQA